MRRISLVLALALLACGGPKKKDDEFPVPEDPPDAAVAAAEPLPDTLTARVEHAVGFVESLAAAAEQAGKDCDKMATDMKALADGPDGKSLLDMNVDPEYRAHAAAVNDKYGPRLDKLGNRLSDAIEVCIGTDKRISDVLIQVGLIAPDGSQP